jgi:hypothetical protein
MALLATSLAAGCSEPIHVGSDLGEPLATLSARVEGPAPEALAVDRVRAALLWGHVSPARLACLETADADRCQPLAGFSPVGSSHTLQIDPVFPTAFQVPLHTFPRPELLMSGSGGRLGYAELVLFEDGNGNGGVDLVAADATGSVDVVVASAPPGAAGEHVWIIFAEGKLPRDWSAFAAYGCVEPPPGYSVVRIAIGAEPVCWVGEPASVTIPVRFDDSDAVRELICEPCGATKTYPAQPPPPDASVFCRGRDALEFVTDPAAYCPRVQTYELLGCDGELVCVEPHWDLSESPPAWWPCDGSESGGFTLIDGQNAWTDGADELFYIEYTHGDRTFDMSSLAVRVWLTNDAPLLLRGEALAESGGDGSFAVGDTVAVRERLGSDDFDATTETTTYTVELVTGETETPYSAGELAVFLWAP